MRWLHMKTKMPLQLKARISKMHIYLHTYIHTYINYMDPWACHKDSSMWNKTYTYTNLQHKILHTFYKNNINHLYTQKKFNYRVKEVCMRYFLEATLNFAQSFLRIVTLGGNCWKFLCQHRMYNFEKKTGWNFD